MSKKLLNNKNNLSMKAQSLKDEGGNLLIEAIVAISVVLIGFLGVFSLLSRSLGINKDISQKFIATYLATEGIEVVKSLIDKDFVNGDSFNKTVKNGGPYEVNYNSKVLDPSSGNPLLFDSTSRTYNYTTGDPTPFTRTIFIKEIDRVESPGETTDEIKVLSRVEWSVRGSTQVIELEDHFFDWR